MNFINWFIFHFKKIMDEFIDKNPNVIRNYEYFQVLKEHKLCWISEIKF